MKYVYVAGPYTGGDVVQNVRRAMTAANDLLVAGYTPHVPHLCHFLHLLNPQPYEVWMRLDFAWLEKCDVMVRLSGESSGADREELAARKLGMPVVLIDELADGWTEKVAQALEASGG